MPHLFRYFVRRWPGIVRLRPNPSPGPLPMAVTDSEARAAAAELMGVSELYVDFNSVVHMCARSVLADAKVPVPPGTEDDPEGAIVDASLRHLTYLVGMLQPSHVFVAVDGVPPRAKMVQQRSRRYIGVHRAERIHAWDTNAITPGTSFMRRLCAALREWEGACPSTVSGDEEEGEGEQKIFVHIRAGCGLTSTVAVYSLDADILLMALALPQQQRSAVRVVREQDLGGPVQVVSVAELARHVLSDLRAACGPASGSSSCGGGVDADCMLADYVAALGLLGNDFVPSLPGFRIADGAVDAVVRAYATAMMALPGRRLASGGPVALGGLDPDVLGIMVSCLAEEESLAVERTERALEVVASRTLASQTGPSGGEVLLRDSYPVSGCRLTSLAGQGWRMRYHDLVFGVFSPESAQKAAMSYFLSFAWSAAYMRQHCLCRGMHYPYTHAPTAMDLGNVLGARGSMASRALGAAAEDAYMAADRAHTAAVSLGIVDTATWQLMMVLPPQSAHLVPCPAAQRVVAGRAAAAAHMYPVAFRIATYGREKLHECSPMLPGLDADLLVEALVDAAG